MSVAITSPEERKNPRLAVERIVVISLGEHNGGIISNISEGGLCFQAVAPIQQRATIDFWLSESGQRIGGVGRIVWTDETHTRGGLFFDKLSVRAREQICHLITKPAAMGNASISGKSRDNRAKVIRSIGHAVIAAGAAKRILGHGFLGGVVTGALISLLVAAPVLYRRQIGEWLIITGEHLASRSTALREPANQPNEKRSPGPAIFERPDGINTTERLTKGRNLPSTSSSARIHVAQQAPPVAQHWQKKYLAKEERVDAAAPINPPIPAGTTLLTPGAANLLMSRLKSLPVPSVSLSAPRTPTLASAGKISKPQPTNTAVIRVETLLKQAVSESSTRMYFEIAKFRDKSWAAEERDKLALLGFPAAIVQKHRLWMNSYYVLVGPYQESEQADAARRNLLSRGFQPRAFERGSRDFALPPHLMLHGERTPVGDCIISWESYLADVKVNFERDSYVIARARGTWVKREPKYDHNAIVYLQGGDGSRKLLELRFAGMNRALVFTN